MHGSAGRTLSLCLGNLDVLASGVNAFKNTEAVYTLVGKCDGTCVAPHAVVFIFGVCYMKHERPFIFETGFAPVSIFNDHATTEREVEFDALDIRHWWGVEGAASIPDVQSWWRDANPIKTNS